MVIRQGVDERLEAADRIERRPPQSHGRAEAAGAEPQSLRDHGLGQKAVIDVQRGEIGPEPAARNPAVQAGDETRRRRGAAIEKRRHHLGQIGGRDAHVAIGDDEDRMARRGQHIAEIGDLEIGAAAPRIDDQRHVARRKFRHERLHHGDGRVVCIGDAEDELEDRIILAAEGAQILGQRGILAMQRLQDAHERRGTRRKRRRGAAAKASNGVASVPQVEAAKRAAGEQRPCEKVEDLQMDAQN